MSGFRLPPVAGEWIDRSRPLRFVFEGKPCTGFSGDTVSSALWAAGQQVLGRSFKYHRPRGILSFANHDVNVLLQSEDDPHLRADVVPLQEGMQLRAVNHLGSLAQDPMAILDRLSPVLPVGFYYKAFYQKNTFPLWEKLFRRVAGLGVVDFTAPRRSTPKDYDFCDVAIVGAGPSGLAAAWAAAEQGAQVLLIDENPRPGGSAQYQRGGSQDDYRVLQAWLQRVTEHPNIRLRMQTTVAGYYADHWLALVDMEQMTKLRARAVIIATGCIEQPAVFRNNDLPGVMLGSAAQRLLYRHAVAAGRAPLIFAGNDDAYRLAEDLLAHDIPPMAIVDLRSPEMVKEEIQCRLRKRGVNLLYRYAVVEALSGVGKNVVTGARIAPWNNGEVDWSTSQAISCDSILVSVGWAPAANLLYQAGARMRYATHVEQFVPEVLPDGIFACGRVTGVFTAANQYLDGLRAGEEAAAFLGHGTVSRQSTPAETHSPTVPWPIVEHPEGKNFVDFDEDIQLKDYINAAQEGFDNIELMKRFTTNGMGPSQGKHSNMNALRILGRLQGMSPEAVGTTTARPFYHPVPLSILAGRGFHPYRHTALHAAHLATGGQMLRMGEWVRPEFYREDKQQDRLSCIWSEVLSVRNGVGLIDVSTLGKIEIHGPQAAEFLERVYISRYAKLKIGLTRYGVMCDEQGVVIDDGVVGRLAPDHFYVTTTSSGASTVYRDWSRWNTWWGLDCTSVNLTGTFAAMNLAGPKSREVLEQITNLDLRSESFPYLGIREGTIAGAPARVLRVGFVGEWGYEIHVPASYAEGVWNALLSAGASAGIRPFGVEAQRIMRLEKGHILLGQDSDGLTHPYELGLDWAVKMDKTFFIGQRSLQILQRHPKQRRLCGFRLRREYEQTPPLENHLVIAEDHIVGRVTSIAFSPTLDAYIGLALVERDFVTNSKLLPIRLSNGELVYADIVDLPFYDPEQRRQQEASNK
ncbi:FAD-dependent oxidoreductase [Acidithiobacillus sp. AMEEHan]|uniref:FAD-dependent oxidoreductase n=1 Tax=Acidithiobacillus sp. AMEEHan TaxID=2994951 RepID=UPI0027E43731|nr:FAD-dependent oxidoreductase [Acidithiobacillus sp. AMEEHan]